MDKASSKSNEICDGNALRRVFAIATRVLERNAEAINSLNVFPVPDGDTGTNMLLTMRAVNEEASRTDSLSTADVAAAMARGALLGARGNSGVILSQFFKGLAQGLQQKGELTGPDLAYALERATECAYKAVSKPTEGTMLTVIKEAARAAQKKALDNGNLAEVWQSACQAAKDTLALTPTMLPILRDAGVVDAGGQGLVVLLEGALRCFRGEDEEAIASDMALPVGMQSDQKHGHVSQDFLTATQGEIYGYCTQLLIQGNGLDVDAIREKLASIAESTVVVGDDTLVKLHTHTSDPGPIISYAASQGSLSQIKIDNIDEQHQEYLAARLKEIETSNVCVVAVVSGKGFASLFRNLGAWGLISGGDTMNPSTQEILKLAEEAPSEKVIILPNNKNIIPSATQACDLTRKTLKVLPTASIPQGIAALLSFNPEHSLEANLSNMERAYGKVRSGEVTRAIRDVSIGGVSVRKGQFIGLLEGKLVSGGDDLTGVLLDLVRRAKVSEGNLVTLYWGHNTTREDAERDGKEIQGTFPGIEIEVVYGGQPYYHYVISIE